MYSDPLSLSIFRKGAGGSAIATALLEVAQEIRDGQTYIARAKPTYYGSGLVSGQPPPADLQ
jgi:hypothetical protein